MIYSKNFPAMKPFLLVGGVLLGLCTGGNLSAYGQGTAPAQTTPTAPAATTPATPAQAVSTVELQKFAKVVKQLLTLDQTTETAMVAAIEKTGLPKDRFLAIYLAKRDPAGKPDLKLTADEATRYTTAETQIMALQKQAIAQQEAAIKSEGFDAQRFNQIMNTVQGDPKLQQDLKKMLQS